MEPVYRNIEFCRDPETLWGKLREGRWDWLGVHPNGQFVLGSPRRSGGVVAYAEVTVERENATAGIHGVRVYTEPRHGQEHCSKNWFRSAEEAQREFLQRVADFQAREGPLLAKVELVMDGLLAEREFVVKRPVTYGQWRPPPGFRKS